MSGLNTAAVMAHPEYLALATQFAEARAELDLYRQQARDLRDELVKAPSAAPVRPSPSEQFCVCCPLSRRPIP